MLIGLQDVSFEFGARTIVSDATWHINPGERIGFIGTNGTGKSTLLKVLVGEYGPNTGTVEKPKSTTIGYLHQDLLSLQNDESILSVALSAFEKIKELEKEIDTLTHILEKESTEEQLHLYSEKLHEYEVLGGYNVEHKASEVLQCLGFRPEQLHQPFLKLSGGWRMRVILAKMILQQPDLLLLDEPTNHLDLPSIEWLEKYLQHYQGSVIIVSHDKFFLNRMVNKIVELYQQKLHFYNGNYDYYEKEKQMRIDIQQRAYENQQDEIRQQERFIERFRAKATKAAAAQSAMKRLEKMEKIEQIEIDRPMINISFKLENNPGKVICTLKQISKRYQDNQVILEKADVEIYRGDKIALVGANGKGKSTLLRIVAGAEAHEGERKWGHKVQESFYAQHQIESLHVDYNILQELQTCESGKNDLELRTLLGCFLFTGDDVDKKIKILSGGERARVALAKVIVSKSNFLLLDEPTNHLDMFSIDLLSQALNKYEGSYILVSHDRYFISKTANKIWEIVDHQIKEFVGTYDEWVLWKERQKTSKLAESKEGNSHQSIVKEANNKSAVITPMQKNKTVQTTLDRQFQKVEKRLQALTDKKKGIEKDLADTSTYKSKDIFLLLEKEYQALLKELEGVSKEYEVLFEQMLTEEK